MLTLLICLSGLAFASNENYPEALPLLNMVDTTRVPKELHHKYYFYKTVTEFQLLRKEEAIVSSALFFTCSFEKPPIRYRNLIYGIQTELTKQTNPLKDIADKMGDVKRRLGKGDISKPTIERQKEIVEDLAKLIKEAEDGASQAQSDSEKEEDEKNGIKKKKNGSSDPLTPADESAIMGGKGHGEVNQKELRQVAEQWGNLPPAKRAKIVEDITRDVPQKYKQVIEEYFKALNRTYNFK